MKKFLTRALIAIVVLFIGVMLFVYYATFSEGVESGVVVKISKKGMMFKTYEGQLNRQTFGGSKDEGNQLNEVWTFSVESDSEDVHKALEDVSLSGERVSLQYVQRYARLPWRGDTRYFVQKVIRSDEPVIKDSRRNPVSH